MHVWRPPPHAIAFDNRICQVSPLPALNIVLYQYVYVYIKNSCMYLFLAIFCDSSLQLGLLATDHMTPCVILWHYDIKCYISLLHLTFVTGIHSLWHPIQSYITCVDILHLISHNSTLTGIYCLWICMCISLFKQLSCHNTIIIPVSNWGNPGMI